MPLSARVAVPPGVVIAHLRQGPVAQAVRAELARRGDPEGDDAVLTSFYEARGDRAIWVQGWGLKPAARTLVRLVQASADDGLDPDAYSAANLERLVTAAGSGRPADLARAEVALSRAFAAWASDLHTPAQGAAMLYADPAVAPPKVDRLGVLQFAARTSPETALARLSRMNPIYRRLRAAYAQWRAEGGPPGRGRMLLANLERARALPPDLGRRYVLVDAAAQKLWMYQDDQAVDSMDVVVGKVSEPTPVMAGLIRYAVARPYWNVPPDLVKDSIAPKVLTFGPAWLARQNMEALSDWSPEAQVLDPSAIDWQAVASGARVLRVRQRPGPHNMMGEVKFIFPNQLGVYLHDTPLRQFFAETRRTESAGCVRLADAPRLARWLLGGEAAGLTEPGQPEQPIDLAQPVPVYIVYLTADPEPEGLVLHPDIYGRDSKLEAAVAKLRAPGARRTA